MIRVRTNDLDHLTARLHGRRSRLAEAGQLDALCRLRDLSSLIHALYPGQEVQTAGQFQQHVVQSLARELSGLSDYLNGAEARLLAWIIARLEVENLKVIVRGLATHTPLSIVRQHLIPLPGSTELGAARAGSLTDLIASLPPGPLRDSLQRTAIACRDDPRPFFLEAALDRGYFIELLDRARQLSACDRETIMPMICQEVDIFHLLLVARGRFLYGLPPVQLMPFHVEGTGILRSRFARMLNAASLAAALGAPHEPAAAETLAWSRYLLLANRAFRRSHMGFGAVVGYTGIRRLEVANLITLSEALRTGMSGEAVRPRLIPRTGREVPNV